MKVAAKTLNFKAVMPTTLKAAEGSLQPSEIRRLVDALGDLANTNNALVNQLHTRISPVVASFPIREDEPEDIQMCELSRELVVIVSQLMTVNAYLKDLIPAIQL